MVEDTYYAGIYVYDADTAVTGNQVRNVFYDECYWVEGTGGTISNNQAQGAAFAGGFYLDVNEMSISSNTAQFNAYDGLWIEGNDNAVTNNTARHNGDDYIEWETAGLYIEGDGNQITGNLAEMNPGHGFWIDGPNTVSSNTAANNYRTGIYLYITPGAGTLMVNNNVATNNHGEGIANFATNVCNIVNNIALGNRTDICDEAPLAFPPDAFNGNTFLTGGPGLACCLEDGPTP